MAKCMAMRPGGYAPRVLFIVDALAVAGATGQCQPKARVKAEQGQVWHRASNSTSKDLGANMAGQCWRYQGADTPLSPTFVRADIRNKPPLRPAGIEQCNSEVRSRWAESGYKHPPYNVLPQHCVANRKGKVVPPSSGMREVLMGFPAGLTFNAFPTTQRKAKPPGLGKRALLTHW